MVEDVEAGGDGDDDAGRGGPFGRSPKTRQPISVAKAISRYCIGARVAEGAKRSDEVMTRCAAVPKKPRTEEEPVGAGDRDRGELGPAAAAAEEDERREDQRRDDAARRLQQHRLGVAGDLPGDSMKKEKRSATAAAAAPGRRRRRSWLHHQHRPDEADGAGGEPVRADRPRRGRSGRGEAG